jgi:drug/metabolite transporter (DMT)-like permease
MTFLGSIATLFLKKSSEVTEKKKNKNIYIGGSLYFMAALINIYVLHYLDYSTVLPFTSITYIWTMILSYFVLKEKMTMRKAIGVIGIVIGVILIAKSKS